MDIIHRALTSFTGVVVTTLKGAVPLQCCYKGGICCCDNFDIIAKVKTGFAVLLNERCDHNGEQTGNTVVKVTAFWRSTNLGGERGQVQYVITEFYVSNAKMGKYVPANHLLQVRKF